MARRLQTAIVYEPVAQTVAGLSHKKSDMTLESLYIVDYKNIRDAQLSFSPKINCFVGLNGMGKTNVLDAIHFLSFCKSGAAATDSAAIRHEADFFVIEGRYIDEGGQPIDIYCGLKRGQKKIFKRDKKAYRRLADHIGLIPLIWISPSDTALIDGPGDNRRRLMDMAISQIDGQYLAALGQYNKALQQRNSLLKLEQEPDPVLMDVIDSQMAASGELIYAKRSHFVEQIQPAFQDFYARISGGKEQVSLNYTSHCSRAPLFDIMKESRQKDRIMGFSLHGVHRDDLEMLIDGYPLRREGSQGQHKSYVIALKLAQFGLLSRTASATTPLLLLDDIFDKLDSERVRQIVDIVGSEQFGQIFITDTNRDHIDSILRGGQHDYKIFAVTDGEISERHNV